MIDGIPKISVLVITYNQEKVISRAIDSLLAQQEYIYEICVSDDCSQDNTWRLLQDYSEKYPGLFVLNRNESNVGIFENIEKTWTMPTGDMIYRLAGDDECGKGLFKHVVGFIEEKKIDYKNELCCIYSDYMAVYPNGDSFIVNKRIIESGIDPVRLSTRGLLGSRATCYSRRILDKYHKVSQGRSYLPESAMDRQLQFFAETNYYLPIVGNIYYAQIGVNVHFNSIILEQREAIEEYARLFFEKQGYRYNSKDLKFIEYKNEKAKNYRDGSFRHRLKELMLYIQSYDASLGLKQLKIKRLFFAIAHRLPHRIPISWRL